MMDRKYVTLGYLTLLALGCLAWVYNLERMAFIDAAQTILDILSRNSFVIEDRFTSALVQAFPLVASRLGASLNSVLISYSISFVVWPLVIYAILVHWLRAADLAFGFVLSMVLMLSHGFFWVANQIQIAIWLTVLAYGFIWVGVLQSAKWRIALAYVLGMLAVLTHPLGIVAFLFLHGFFILQRRERPGVHTWGLPLFAAFIWITKLAVFVHPYDAGRYRSIENFVRLFPHYLGIPANHEFLAYVGDSYYLAILILGLNALYYWGTNAWLKLIWMIGVFAGYLMVINVTLYGGIARFYVELEYQPLAFFIAIPFAVDVLPAIRLRKAAFWLVCVILALRIALIIGHSGIYRERVHWHEAMIERLREKQSNRFVIEEKDAPVQKLILTWAASAESLLISSIPHTPRSITYVIDSDMRRYEEVREEDDIFLTKWTKLAASQLPSKYFSLAPARYEKLSKEDIVP